MAKSIRRPLDRSYQCSCGIGHTNGLRVAGVEGREMEWKEGREESGRKGRGVGRKGRGVGRKGREIWRKKGKGRAKKEEEGKGREVE